MDKKTKITKPYSVSDEKIIIKEASKYDNQQKVEMLLQYWNDSGAFNQNPLTTENQNTPVIPNPVKPSCTCKPKKENIQNIGIEPIKQDVCVPVTQCGSSGNFIPKCKSLKQYIESDTSVPIQESCSCECVPVDESYKCECDSFNCDECSQSVNGFVSYGAYTSIPTNPKIDRCCDECCTDDTGVDVNPDDDDPDDDDFDPTLTAGCTDIYAANFDADAETDDGSCCYDNICLIEQGLDPIYGTEVGGGQPGDVTGDGALDVMDIVWIVNCILGGENPNFDSSQCDPIPGYYIPPYHDCEDEGGCDNGESCCDEFSCCDGEGMDCLPEYYIDPEDCPETCVNCTWETLNQQEFLEALTQYLEVGWTSDQEHDVFPSYASDLSNWILMQMGNYDWATTNNVFETLFAILTNGSHPSVGYNFVDTYCPSLPVLGCTDSTACNQDISAEQNDGSCVYPPYGLGCDCSHLEIIGNCWNSNIPYCQEGFCDEVVVGCMDTSACNYNPLANLPCDSSSIEDSEPLSASLGNYCRFTKPTINQLCPCGNWMDFFFDVNRCYMEGDTESRSCNYDIFNEMPSPPNNFIIEGGWEGEHPNNQSRWIYNNDDRRKIHPGYGDFEQQRATLDRYCLETCNGTPVSYEENVGWSLGTDPQSSSSGQSGFTYYNYSGAGFGVGVRWKHKAWYNSGMLVPSADAWIDCNCQEQIPGVCEWSEEVQVMTEPGPNDCCCYIGDSSSSDGNDCEIDLSAEGTCACDGTINYGCGCNDMMKLTYYRDDDKDGMGCLNEPVELCPTSNLVIDETYVPNYDDDDCECPNTCGGSNVGSIIYNSSAGYCNICTTPGGGLAEQENVGTFDSVEQCCAEAFGLSFSDYSVETSDDCTINSSWIGYQCIQGSSDSCIDDCGACVPNGEDSDEWNATCTGCTDSTACNYDYGALFDDGSCHYQVETTCFHGVSIGGNDPTITGCYDQKYQFSVCSGDCSLLGSTWYSAEQLNGGNYTSQAQLDCAPANPDHPDTQACNYIDPTPYNGCYQHLYNCQYPTANVDCNLTTWPQGQCYDGWYLDLNQTSSGEPIYDCNGDCALEVDECGVCGGTGIPDGECDCAGNVLDECGVCNGGNALDLGCGCSVSGPIMYWPDDDGDGLAQGEGFEWCSDIGLITSITCGDYGVHAGTGNCLVPESGWEDHCSNLDTTTNTCNEEQDPNCESFTYDCLGVCDGTATTDDCGVCEGGNADQNICGVCFEPDPEPIYNCAGECIESTDRYGACCYSSDIDTCNICFGGDDKDLCGVCIADGGDNSSCSGCTDPAANNYDSTAIVDNGTCQYIDGCTDVSADNYDSNATADDGTCCNFSDLNNQQALACNYLIDNSTYCNTATSTAYYDLHCTNSVDFIPADGNVSVDSVDRFVGDTPSVELQFPFNATALTNYNYVAYTLQESKNISIINDSFYSEQPQTFTEFGGSLSDYNTYLQGIKVDINDSYSGLTIQINEGSNIVGYTYWGSLAPYFLVGDGDEEQNGWIIPAGTSGQFNPGQGLFIVSTQFPGTHLKFYLESS